MGKLEKDLKRKFTYKDYLTWPDDERWELIKGVPFNMTPAPSVNHQRISRELSAAFYSFLKEKSCELFVAPFDVRLPQGRQSDKEILTVVQPDLAVICDPQKIDQHGCQGSPDLIVEITSPSTLHKDMKHKLNCYEEAGVQEYWIVHPEGKTIVVYLLSEEGHYARPQVYSSEDSLPVGLFPGFSLTLKEIFSVIRAEA